MSVLTRREKEVLQLIADGNRAKEIADKLGISQKTVEAHKQNIKLKLSIPDTAGLVKYAIREGIAEL
jgi:DNA-binding CsgD family transcriptional regulator